VEAVVGATAAAKVGPAASGRLTRDRLEEAVARTDALARAPLGRVDGVDPHLGLVAARRALRVEGDLPAVLPDGLVIQLEPPAPVAVGEVPWGLATDVAGVETLRLPEAGDGAEDAILARAVGRPLVLVSRDTHRHPPARALAEALSARHPAVVLVEMGWPAAWRPAGLLAYVATYGAAPVNARAAAEILRTGGNRP
jgi:beta-N-acetylhexosaminidase